MIDTAQDHALKVGMLQDMIDVIDLEKKLSGSETQGVAECCSVLQSVAVCCRVLQSVAVCCVCVICFKTSRMCAVLHERGFACSVFMRGMGWL